MARARTFFAFAVGTSILLAAGKLGVSYGWLVPADGVSPFPTSGDVIVGSLAGRSAETSLLTIHAPLGSDDNYVVRLVDPASGVPALTLFLRPHTQVTIPVPLGAYGFRLAHGQSWRGMHGLFGSGTKAETTPEPIVVTKDGPGSIEIGSNLPTRTADRSAF